MYVTTYHKNIILGHHFSTEFKAAYDKLTGTMPMKEPYKSGVCQGDLLAYLRFNIALEKPFRKSGLQTWRTVFCKSDVKVYWWLDISGKSRTAMEKFFLAMRMGLYVNLSKTKYVVGGKACRQNIPYVMNERERERYKLEYSLCLRRENCMGYRH